MFIDEVGLILKAGDGGNGKVSFFPGKKSGPDGGDGGNGGDIVVLGSKHISNLNEFINNQTLSAENGQNGGNNNKTGAGGKDLILRLPINSQLLDQDRGEVVEITSKEEPILVAKGGKGGKGNAFFKSAANTTPKKAEPGETGEKKHFKISLPLIANFALIGLPNAGKSSLLNTLTNAKAKTASYPFTTLETNLGDFNGKIIADIPGLIEGASKGKGLGISFLKNLKKTSLLLHCISSESENIVRDYKVIGKELKEYEPALMGKKQVILLTKTDLIGDGEIKKKIALLKKLHKTILPVSIYQPEKLSKLKALLLSI